MTTRMRTQDPDTMYHTKRLLHIPNPGQDPPVLEVAPGGLFTLDGNEGVHIERLIREGTVTIYKPKARQKEASNG
tara:strand:- start:441 stop:665 length:225 start_codon:yes stop_codon:yes gene_type:complete